MKGSNQKTRRFTKNPILKPVTVFHNEAKRTGKNTQDFTYKEIIVEANFIYHMSFHFFNSQSPTMKT